MYTCHRAPLACLEFQAPPPLLPPAGKVAHPASMVGAKAVEMAAGGQSDEIVRLYLD